MSVVKQPCAHFSIVQPPLLYISASNTRHLIIVVDNLAEQIAAHNRILAGRQQIVGELLIGVQNFASLKAASERISPCCARARTLSP